MSETKGWLITCAKCGREEFVPATTDGGGFTRQYVDLDNSKYFMEIPDPPYYASQGFHLCTDCVGDYRDIKARYNRDLKHWIKDNI